MPKNIEIKARLSTEDFDRISGIASRISDTPVQTIIQRDTFFSSRSGRLKLRQFLDEDDVVNERAELIFYQRTDQKGPKASCYSRIEVGDSDSLIDSLAQSNGVVGVVDKKRMLYLIGQTRVHMDTVEGLGEFVELEVVLKDDQDDQFGQRIANDLIQRLGIQIDDLVERAYIDLLAVVADG